jgi:hypothetical protein
MAVAARREHLRDRLEDEPVLIGERRRHAHDSFTQTRIGERLGQDGALGERGRDPFRLEG